MLVAFSFNPVNKTACAQVNLIDSDNTKNKALVNCDFTKNLINTDMAKFYNSGYYVFVQANVTEDNVNKLKSYIINEERHKGMSQNDIDDYNNKMSDMKMAFQILSNLTVIFGPEITAGIKPRTETAKGEPFVEPSVLVVIKLKKTDYNPLDVQEFFKGEQFFEVIKCNDREVIKIDKDNFKLYITKEGHYLLASNYSETLEAAINDYNSGTSNILSVQKVQDIISNLPDKWFLSMITDNSSMMRYFTDITATKKAEELKRQQEIADKIDSGEIQIIVDGNENNTDNPSDSDESEVKTEDSEALTTQEEQTEGNVVSDDTEEKTEDVVEEKNGDLKPAEMVDADEEPEGVEPQEEKIEESEQTEVPQQCDVFSKVPQKANNPMQLAEEQVQKYLDGFMNSGMYSSLLVVFNDKAIDIGCYYPCDLSFMPEESAKLKEGINKYLNNQRVSTITKVLPDTTAGYVDISNLGGIAGLYKTIDNEELQKWISGASVMVTTFTGLDLDTQLLKLFEEDLAVAFIDLKETPEPVVLLSKTTETMPVVDKLITTLKLLEKGVSVKNQTYRDGEVRILSHESDSKKFAIVEKPEYLILSRSEPVKYIKKNFDSKKKSLNQSEVFASIEKMASKPSYFSVYGNVDMINKLIGSYGLNKLPDELLDNLKSLYFSISKGNNDVLFINTSVQFK